MAVTVEVLCPKLAAASPGLNSSQRDLLDRCTDLIVNSVIDPNASAQGMVALTPEQASAPRKLNAQVTGAQLDNVAARLAALRRGARGISLRGLTFEPGAPRWLDGAFAGQPAETGGAASADSDDPFERLGVFVSGSVDWGNKDQTRNEDGFDFDTLGLTAGLDYRLAEGLVLGAALGYGDTSADIDANGGDLDARTWSATLYGTYYPTDHFYLEGSATYGWGSYDQTRNIDYSLLGAPRAATSSFDGNQYALVLGGGYDLIAGGAIVDFYGRMRYVNVELDGYTEQGANGLDLNVQGQDMDALTSVLGVQYTRSISTALAVLVPQAWVEWIHEFEAGDEAVSGRFVNDPNAIPFILATDRLDSDYYRAGLGLGAQLGKGRILYANLEAVFGLASYSEYNASIGVRLEF
jgi:outer membrane autotransporter protein